MAINQQSITEDRASGAKVINGSCNFTTVGTDFASGNFLIRTPTSVGNVDKWTWSGWVKRSGLYSNGNNMFAAFVDDSNRDTIRFGGLSADCFEYQNRDGGTNYGNRTNAVYRDVNGWYHTVVVYDSSAGSGSRVKYYINGSQVTDLTNQAGGEVSSGQNSHINTTYAHYLAARKDSSGVEGSLDGYMAEVNFVDGLALDASHFGFTDPLTNEWRPKDFTTSRTGYNTSNDNVEDWSSMTTGSPYNSSTAIYEAFDGNTSEFAAPTTSSYFTFTPTTAITGITNVRLTVQRDTSTSSTIELNDVDISSSWSPNTTDTVTFARTTLSKLKWGTDGSNQWFSVAKIEVEKDGTYYTLIQGDVNGFYLPMDGSAPVGKDQSGKGNDWLVNTANPDWGEGNGAQAPLHLATGAIPIMNTASGGKTASGGVRGVVGVGITVYNSGSGDKFYLNGVEAGSYNFVPGQTITFDTSDSTCATHPFRLSGTSDGSHNAFYSVDFDGTDDYLTLAASSDFALGTNDFTIECWVKYTTFSVEGGMNRRIFCLDNGSGNTADNLQLSIDNNAKEYSVYVYSNTWVLYGGQRIYEGSPHPGTNGWHHVAITRSNSTIRIFIDGQLMDSASNTQSYSPNSGSPRFIIGAGNDGSVNGDYDGNIADFRLINGTCLYESDFTPPSTSLTSVTNTKLLCCNQSTVTAYTTSPGTITANGDPAISNSNPYDEFVYTTVTSISEGTVGAATTITLPTHSPTNLYYYCTSHSGMGGSVSIGATDPLKADPYAWKCVNAVPFDYRRYDESLKINCTSLYNLMTSSGAVTQDKEKSAFYGTSYVWPGSANAWVKSYNEYTGWTFHMCPFTVEFWIYITDVTQDGAIISNMTDFSDSGEYNTRWVVGLYSSELRIWTANAGSHILHDYYPTQGAWTHYAWTKGPTDGNGSAVTNTLYKNGSAIFEVTVTDQDFTTGGELQIGHLANLGTMKAYMNDVRIYRTVKYRRDFIPASTHPHILPESPSGVVYGIEPINRYHLLSGSNRFDGTGDTFSVPTSSDFAFGTGDFTVECWVYKMAEGYLGLYDFRDGSDTNTFSFSVTNSEYLGVIINGTLTETPSTFGIDLYKWYHLAFSRHGTTARLFYNGREVKTWTDSTSIVAPASDGWIGSNAGSGNMCQTYISNMRVLKGTALYTHSFAPPTKPLTAITNTKLLCCNAASTLNPSVIPTGSITASGDVAADSFSPFEIEGGYAKASNYCTMNAIGTEKSAYDVYDGNLTVGNSSAPGGSSGARGFVPSTIGMKTGKWYAECVTYRASDGDVDFGIGIFPQKASGYYSTSGCYACRPDAKLFSPSGTNVSYGTAWADGDVIGMRVDLESSTKTITWYINGFPSGAAVTIGEDDTFYFGYGSDGGGGGRTYTSHWNFGQKPFKFGLPEGYNIPNVETPSVTLPRPDQWHGIVSWAGNQTARNIGGLNFQPDLVLGKCYSDSGHDWDLYDSVRGIQKKLKINTTAAEGTEAQGLMEFNSDGFQLGTDPGLNDSSKNFIGYCFKAGGNAGTFNKDGMDVGSAAAAGVTGGSITPTACSVGTRDGFSILKYTGTGNASDTIATGLDIPVDFYIVKSIDNTGNWNVASKAMGLEYSLVLNANVDKGSSSADYWNSTDPTNTLLSIGTADSVNGDGWNFILYAWANRPGLQKFGTYEGNGDSDGPFVEMGFRPSLLIIKNADDSGEGWVLWDNVRQTYNNGSTTTILYPDQTNAEGNDSNDWDILSNGIKLRSSGNMTNKSLTNYVYMAWAESPGINLYGAQALGR